MKFILLATTFFSGLQVALSSPVAKPQYLYAPHLTTDDKHNFVQAQCKQYRTGFPSQRYRDCTTAANEEWRNLYGPPLSALINPVALTNLNNRCASACNGGKNAMLSFCNSGAYWDKPDSAYKNCFKRADDLSKGGQVPNGNGATWGQVDCWDHCIKNFGRANFGL